MHALFSVVRGPFVLSARLAGGRSGDAGALAQADALFDQGHLYKTGGAASVAKVEVAGRPPDQTL